MENPAGGGGANQNVFCGGVWIFSGATQYEKILDNAFSSEGSKCISPRCTDAYNFNDSLNCQLNSLNTVNIQPPANNLRRQ